MTAPVGWRTRARIAAELLVLFGGLSLVDWRLAGWSGFEGYQPSPWWLPVIAMALAYGTGPGVIAAAIASGMWLLHEHAGNGERDYLDHLFRLSLPVLFWFVTAVVIGEATNVRAARVHRLRRRAKACERNLDRIGEAFDRLAETNRALQAAVAREEATPGHIVAAATRLAAADPAEREAAVLHLVAVAAATRDFTVYRLREGEGRAWLNGPEAQGRADLLPPDLRLALRGRQGPLTVARRADRAAVAAVGVVAMPLVDRDGGDQVACLVLHRLPFDEMNAYRMAELAELAAWLGPVLGGLPGTARLAQAGRVA